MHMGVTAGWAGWRSLVLEQFSVKALGKGNTHPAGSEAPTHSGSPSQAPPAPAMEIRFY